MYTCVYRVWSEPRLEPEREFAPWERRDAEEQPYHEEEFDEDQFLRGRVPVVRRSVERELPETEGRPHLHLRTMK